MKKLAPFLVLVSFTIYSTYVALHRGGLGFLGLAAREPWAMQMLVDLCIALTVSAFWIRRDAKAHGLPGFAYIVTLPFLGSIGTLAYLAHRALSRTTRSS